MDQSSGNEICFSGGCESESRVLREVGDYAEMNYHPCDEICSQHSAEIEFNVAFTKGNSGLQNTKDKCFIEQCNNSTADSNNELYDNEELTDLLHRYHAKCNSDVTAQSTVEERGGGCGFFESKNSSSRGCESESGVACDAAECADMNYNPCLEVSSQDSTKSYSCEKSDEENSSSQNIKQEYLAEQSNASLDNSSEDLSDSEEFAELLHRCYSKSESDVMMQSADGETVAGRSAESDCAMTDVKEEDESDSETYADSSVTQPTNAEGTTEQDMTSTSLPPDNTTQHNSCPPSKNFSNINLKQHIQRIHHNERQHCCKWCERSYSVESDLTLHIKHVHSDNKYKCDKCEYSSKYSNHLKSHNSAVHLREKLHKCPQCGACFSQKGHLTQHLKSVHNREKPYECSSCDMKFSDRRNHESHWKSVHCGEKSYSCDQCEFKCSLKGNLTRHQRSVHDGLKPFVCFQCEFKCSTMSILKRHYGAVHQQRKTHSCTECGKAFCAASNLKAHVEAVHSGLKPYVCVDCNSRFSQNSKLQKHVKAVHLKEKLR